MKKNFLSALTGVLLDCLQQDRWLVRWRTGQLAKGKPWVDGDVMDTPLGSKWWPNPLWGGDDEAGSFGTKPEVVKRAVAQVKKVGP